jgi:nucleoside-diphosphate-sugar epimerase
VKPVFVAGHAGLVGAAVLRRLQAQGRSVLTATRAELDLRDAAAVQRFFADNPMQALVLAAARVGGIAANDAEPADFLADNLLIQTQVLLAAHAAGVERLVFLGSSCIYPREAAQPMREEALLSGPLEPTNEAYALAKIAGIKLCESLNRQLGRDYRSLMPTNLYGPGDRYDAQRGHVIPALMRRLHEAKLADADELVVWGSGRPLREFLHVDDLAAACQLALELPAERWQAQTAPRRSHLNVGSGEEIAIADLAVLLAQVVGFRGRLRFDTSRPDGAPRKLLDSSRLRALGWAPRIKLAEGLHQTYAAYQQALAGVGA